MENKVWLITGISSGMGQALAHEVMKKGDFVIGTFRNQEQVTQFNSQYQGKGYAIVLDLNKMDEITSTIKMLTERFGEIDVLVNNAGVGFVGAIEEASVSEARNVFEINFFGILQLTQSILSYMRKAKSGHIIQISSHGGIKAFAGFGIYNASKFALEGFSEALAQEVAPFGIKITIVEPGPFRTKFAGSSLLTSNNIIDDYVDTVGVFRSKLRSINGKQEGDHEKAALAVIDLIESGKECLRLPLGKIALTSIEAKIKSIKNDLIENREIAERVVYYE